VGPPLKTLVGNLQPRAIIWLFLLYTFDMVHIVAIGGGEIGRPGYPVETTEIDKQIISLINKAHPRVLFLPTASEDSASYCETFKNHYGKSLGCITEVLKLYDKPNKATVEELIMKADIIYVGGGNTLKMMMLWRKTGVDKILIEASKKGTLLTGLSAGAICWFKAGLSDSRSFTSGGHTWNYINVHGLNIKDILLCPHYDAEPKRQPALKKSLQGSSKIALAVDNCAALEIKDDSFRILSSNKGAKAHKAYWHHGKYFIDDIEPSSKYAPLSLISN
jgi:dipeptidase E